MRWRSPIPAPDPPAMPLTVLATALDESVFITWSDNARDAGDFSHYRVYLDGEETFLLGETDSEGFLDMRARNGETYRYFVSPSTIRGTKAQGVRWRARLPTDYHGELIYSYLDMPPHSGFSLSARRKGRSHRSRQRARTPLPVRTGRDGVVAGPRSGHGNPQPGLSHNPAQVRAGQRLRMCRRNHRPRNGLHGRRVEAQSQTTYILRYSGDGGHHYAAVRISNQGFVDDGAVMVFDWALATGHTSCSPGM